MMAERGVAVSHTTILRWVQYYVPEFEKRWNCYARPVGTSWRVDDTYIKVRGRWSYLYRAVDKHGLTVGFLLSERRILPQLSVSSREQYSGMVLRRGLRSMATPPHTQLSRS